MRERHDVGAQMQPIAERRSQRGREAIVAALDAIHRARCRRLAGRELIEQRDERQLVGIGQEEAAQPGGRRPHLGVGPDLVEPRGHGAARQSGGDGRIPPLLGERVRLGQVLEFVRQTLPSTCCAAARDPRPAGAVQADVAKASPENARERQPKLFRELTDLELRLVDHVAAGFGVLAVGEAVADGPDAPADAIARVDDRDVRAQDEIARRDEPRETRARDEN